MSTRLLMTAAAIVMGLAGLAATFAPDELQRYFDRSTPPLFIQITGALYLGFAMLDWMAKDSALGGIYGRPIVIGNLVHFLVGGLALVKSAPRGEMLVATVIYALFAIGFGYAMMTSPKPRG